MNLRRVVRTSLLAAVALTSACTPIGGGGGGTTTTTASTTTTTTVSAGHVAGLTENQLCAGPVSPSGCTQPFNPASDQVTISRGTVLYMKVQSATNGVFTVDLPPGAYNFDASTNFIGGIGDCPVVPVNIVAGTTVAVTLHCTIELP